MAIDLDNGAVDGIEQDQRSAMLPMTYTLPLPANPGLWRGVNETMKPRFHKVGIVSIREGETPGRGRAFYELRYTDPDSGMEVKRRVSGMDHAEVCNMADFLTRQAYQGKGYLAAKTQVPTLLEGIEHAIALSRAQKSGKRIMASQSAFFLRYMEQHFPGVKTWDALKPSQVESYVRECERQGLSREGMIHRLKALRMAWRVMHADYPGEVKAPPKIHLEQPAKQEIECLNLQEALSLLAWLQVNDPEVYRLEVLAALCGLRQLEAAALRAQDLDFTEKTVTVTETGIHKPKTRDSFRTIPVPGRVLDALRDALTGQKVRLASGEVFINRRGNPWVKDSLTHRVSKALRLAAKALETPRLAMIPARKLRAAFATAASQAGVSDRLLKAYLGHSSGDMLGNHYRRIDTKELRAVVVGFESAIEGLRRKDSGKNEMEQAVNA
jgi:integrase